MATYDPDEVAKETKWLKDHPHFDQKPASISEFIGKDYLGIEDLVRPGLKKALEDIFGKDSSGYRISQYERALITGGVGIGKTTFASIALPYMAHWVLCLRDPQAYFELLPGARIAFMQMSTSEKQAAEVVYGDIFARIQHSPWFINNYPHDDKFTRQIRFPKDVWILPGDSLETSFEGYNILGGILDEMDSHKITDSKDYADVGFDTIESRIASRFTDFGKDGEEAGHRGLLICIGQMKKANGFAARKLKEFKADPKAYVLRMSIWESLGWHRYTRKDGTRASFWYDTKTKKQVPATVIEFIKNDNIIEIPLAYKRQFDTNPEKALRDLAGIPPVVNSPFISMIDKIESCRDRWVTRYEHKSPVRSDQNRIEFEDWFQANGDHRKRVLHIDFATSQDALGMAMGHVEELIKIDDEEKPYIVFDALMRIKARPGQQIILGEVRRIIFNLKEERGFKIHLVTVDGFQSTDTQQQLRKRKFRVDYLSMDKSTWPYEDLREAIYEERIEFPQYLTYIRNGDTELVEIALNELMQLQDTGKKIDHQPDGSKDVADAMAGVVFSLMGDRSFRRGVKSPAMLENLFEPDEATGTDGLGLVLPFPGRGGDLRAPIPPSSDGIMGLTLPPRLQQQQPRRGS